MFRQVKRGSRPDGPSQIAREVRLMKELKAKHEETLLTLERTKTKLEMAEQDQQKAGDPFYPGPDDDYGPQLLSSSPTP